MIIYYIVDIQMGEYSIIRSVFDNFKIETYNFKVYIFVVFAIDAYH